MSHSYTNRDGSLWLYIPNLSLQDEVPSATQAIRERIERDLSTAGIDVDKKTLTKVIASLNAVLVERAAKISSCREQIYWAHRGEMMEYFKRAAETKKDLDQKWAMVNKEREELDSKIAQANAALFAVSDYIANASAFFEKQILDQDLESEKIGFARGALHVLRKLKEVVSLPSRPKPSIRWK